MAELTELEEKLAEVMGLAQAAQGLTKKVGGMVEDQEIATMLERMHDEAAETEQRCTQLAEERDGKKTALQDKARETKREAEAMQKDYLGDDADALDGLEFMIMAEAGELGHVEIVGAMSEKAGEQELRELVEWARPVQQRHFEQTRRAALQLAAQHA
jgi:DNA-binding helix-hairpin-helix protein with protein kinase domain